MVSEFLLTRGFQFEMNREAYTNTAKIRLSLAEIDAPALIRSVGGRVFREYFRKQFSENGFWE